MHIQKITISAVPDKADLADDVALINDILRVLLTLKDVLNAYGLNLGDG